MPVYLRNRIAKAFGVKVQEDRLRAVKAEHAQIVELCKPYSMSSRERLLGVVTAVEYVCKAAVHGHFVECGVYRGGCSMAAAYSFARMNRIEHIHLFDTFEGMPPSSEHDYHNSHLAKDLAPADGSAWCFASIDDVKLNMARTNYPDEKLHFIKGMVESTIPEAAPDEISILRLDTDWYSSTKHELEHLYPRLTRGGVLIIDDYGHWSGSQKAVDEYFEFHGIHMLLNRTDYTGRMGIKM